jgi:Dolichyl-phosphate-mannose-protein mannosyltransferase
MSVAGIPEGLPRSRAKGSPELPSAVEPAYASPKKSRIERYLVMLPLALGAMLVWTNPWFTVVDDEWAIIDRAAKPVSQTLRLFLRGIGEHEHPPLYDIILHVWLRISAGNEHLLRIPSVVFYLLGAWIIAKVAKRLGGTRSQVWVLILITAWPFGFHLARVAAWYSFCFFLVSLLTLNYLRFLARPSVVTWVWFLLASLALVYSNYFGWAVLGCLAFDYVLRNHRDPGGLVRPLLLTGLVLLGSYIPLATSFLRTIHSGTRLHLGAVATIASGIYNLYFVFVSESVAPWFWFLGIPAGIVIFVCLFVTLLWSPAPARSFFFYFLGLFAMMTLLGIVTTKRALFITPWLILPIGVTLGTSPSRLRRQALAAMLSITAGIGWVGIFSRNLYGAPHWVEPWESIARRAAGVVRDHGTVIGNNPSFFFYLTYSLPNRSSSSSRHPDFEGLLPYSVRIPGVYDPQQWILADRPVTPAVLLVKGLDYGVPAGPTVETERWLNDHCELSNLEREVHDAGSQLKKKFAPEVEQPEWRIEIRKYACE